jgi:hypothetical protein
MATAFLQLPFFYAVLNEKNKKSATGKKWCFLTL